MQIRKKKAKQLQEFAQANYNMDHVDELSKEDRDAIENALVEDRRKERGQQERGSSPVASMSREAASNPRISMTRKWNPKNTSLV